MEVVFNNLLTLVVSSKINKVFSLSKDLPTSFYNHLWNNSRTIQNLLSGSLYHT